MGQAKLAADRNILFRETHKQEGFTFERVGGAAQEPLFEGIRAEPGFIRPDDQCCQPLADGERGGFRHSDREPPARYLKRIDNPHNGVLHCAMSAFHP